MAMSARTLQVRTAVDTVENASTRKRYARASGVFGSESAPRASRLHVGVNEIAPNVLTTSDTGVHGVEDLRKDKRVR